MTKQQTIQVLRYVRSGVSSPDEIAKKYDFFTDSEFYYLLKNTEPLLILEGDIVKIHENGYNLLEEADRQDETMQMQDEALAIARRAEVKADETAEENRKQNRITNFISIASLLVSIISLLIALQSLSR